VKFAAIRRWSGCHDESVRIAVLGPLEVSTSDGVIDVAGTRLRTLLIRLAMAAPGPVPVSALVEAVWGADPPAEPANALQSLVSRLRRVLNGAESVQQVSGGYRLQIRADDLDLRRFERLARAGRESLQASRFDVAAATLREALGLWRGDALDAAIENDVALRARLQEQHLGALADRIEADLALGRSDELIAELDQLVATHPLRERLTLLLLQALAGSGRVPEALATYDQARVTLADELGIDPSPVLQAAHLALLRGEPLVAARAVASPGAGAPAATDAVLDEPEPHSRSNLRAQLTSFVGREEDVRRIAKMLGDGRLVTLVGPGGAGKTRLATESVSRLVDPQADRAWLAELAPVSDPGDVPQVVLGALGLRDSTLIDRPGDGRAPDAIGRLVDFFGDRECVLVLDNCEHLIDAAAALTDELLARCPGLRILTTSREPLGVYGEALVVVAPLGQPAPGADPSTAMSYPATQLFADRAAAARPSFVVDEATVGSVVEIVRRLDGLPLAIELAAARLRSMPVEQIAARLTDRFRLLTGGSRTALPRHRTLLAVVEWSWELLSEDERRLARRLAVFIGGITAASATDVCASMELPEDAVEDLLTSLVDKSLVQLVPEQGRYRMLETLREFGLERMAEVGEVSTIRSAHARHFAALAMHADPQLRTRDQLIWLSVLNAERDNIVAALRFLADDGQADAALDVAFAMNWYWVLMGRHGEAVTWTGFALAAPGSDDEFRRTVGEALLAINSAASMWAGSPDAMDESMRAMSEINERLDSLQASPPLHPMLRILRPVIAMFTNDRPRMIRLLDEALTCGDPWTVATARAFRAGMAENDGDAESTQRDAYASLAEFREMGERWGMGNCLQLLAPMHALAGELDEAVRDYREALELFAELGAREDEAMIRLRLAEVLQRQGDIDGARREIEIAVHRTQSQEHESRVGPGNESGFAAIVIADIERQAGNLTRARQLRDEALERIGSVLSPHPAQGHLRAMALLVAAKVDLIDDDKATATQRITEAYQVGVATRDMPIVASMGVGVALLAAALGRLTDAAEILGAAAQIRGADDSTAFDIRELRALLDERLGAAAAAAHYADGRTLGRDDAIARLDPARLS
jgi:predicted ATPase/DNA-binding SARP family transcriptional activator